MNDSYLNTCLEKLADSIDSLRYRDGEDAQFQKANLEIIRDALVEIRDLLREVSK